MSSTSKAYSYSNYNLEDIEEFNNEMKDKYEVLLEILSQFEASRINGEDLLTNFHKFSKSKTKQENVISTTGGAVTTSKRKLSSSRERRTSEVKKHKLSISENSNSETESSSFNIESSENDYDGDLLKSSANGQKTAEGAIGEDSLAYEEKFAGQIHTLLSNTDEEIKTVLKALKLIQHIQGVRAKKCIQKGMSKKSIMMETIDESAKILPLWIKGLPDSSEEEDDSDLEHTNVSNTEYENATEGDSKSNDEVSAMASSKSGFKTRNSSTKRSKRKCKKDIRSKSKKYQKKRATSKESSDEDESNHSSDESMDFQREEKDEKATIQSNKKSGVRNEESLKVETVQLKKRKKSQSSLFEEVPPLCGAEPAISGYKAKAGDGVAAFVGEDWILAEVKCFNENLGKYEIDDIYEKQIHILEEEKVIPLPLYRANPKENPEAIFQTGTLVLALYNTTTCFYKAVVAQAPENPEDPYMVLFEDLESKTKYQDEPKEVFQRYILNFHEGMSYGHIAEDL